MEQVRVYVFRCLLERHQETIHLAVLDDVDIVFEDVIESQQRVKLAAAIGQRLPTFTMASADPSLRMCLMNLSGTC